MSSNPDQYHPETAEGREDLEDDPTPNSASEEEEEEDEQLQALRREKQIYLRTEIISAGYSPEDFQGFIMDQKENGE